MIDPKYETPHWWPKVPKVRPPRRISGTEVLILGCGTSSGVPLLACRCKTCSSKDPRNTRSRASIAIRTGKTTILIDTSPDLKQQALREKLFWIDAVCFTHPHADHVHGIDELRSYNFLMARPLVCYGNDWTLDVLVNRFDYIFVKPAQLGGGRPLLSADRIDKKRTIAGVEVQPLPVVHGKMPVLGYRINDVAYITDCSYIPDQTFKHLKGLDILILDCLQQISHPTHLNVEGAIQLARKIGAKRTYFTHMGHDLEYTKFSKSLPRGMRPAHDGLVLRSRR